MPCKKCGNKIEVEITKEGKVILELCVDCYNKIQYNKITNSYLKS